MTTRLELTPYLPAPLLRRLAARPALPDDAEIETTEGAALHADIVGFTPLAEQLAELGPLGAEQLAATLDDYFGRMIAVVDAHGGEVLQFAGDSLLAWWPDADRAGALARASLCGGAIQRELSGFRAPGERELSLRIGVGSGAMFFAQAGGAEGCWLWTVGGEAMERAATAQAGADSGCVAIAASESTEAAEGRANHSGRGASDGENSTIPFELLEAYVAPAVSSRLSAGHSDWLPELRRVTVVYVNLRDRRAASPEQIAALSEELRPMQSVLERFEGTIHGLNLLDKGCTLLAIFGLPPRGHEDDAIRAVHAALELIQRHAATADRSALAIGIATGRVFTGGVGSPVRREYAVVGGVMNLGARLMQAAEDGEILCDPATAGEAAVRVSFDVRPAVSLKGLAEPIEPRRPRRLEPRGVVAPRAAAAAAAEDPIFGRAHELAVLQERLDALEQGTAATLVLEGEAGIGKSRLLADALAHARARGFPTLEGGGDAVERSTPYHAWRDVYAQALDVDGEAAAAERRAAVHMRLRAKPDLLRLAPLLNAVLPLELPETELTAQLEGDTRAENTLDLLAELLRRPSIRPHGTTGGLVLAIEDAHWLDSASWALLRRLSADSEHLLLLVATRPPDGTPNEDHRLLLDDPRVSHISLESLPPSETVALICHRLGVASLPPPLPELLVERSGGSPFFAEELAHELRDTGVVTIADGECRLTDGFSLDSLTFRIRLRVS